jgi:hypothetical protein
MSDSVEPSTSSQGDAAITPPTFTTAQLGAMDSAIDQAQVDLAAGNYASVISDLKTYYSVQIYEPGTETVMRGYARLALEVLDDTGSGAVADDEVENAVGRASYTAKNAATLAYDLAFQDYTGIGLNGNEVPTLAQVATEHETVFGALGIPITAWGGTPFVALDVDFTDGAATPWELSSVQPTFFADMSALAVETSIMNLYGAGLTAAEGNLDLGDDISGIGSLLALQAAFAVKFPTFTLLFHLGQNGDGSYQVAELDSSAATDGTYSNYLSSGQPNYSVSITSPDGATGPTDASVTDVTEETFNFVLNGGGDPDVLIDTDAGSLSGGDALAAVLIDDGGGTLTGGSGTDLLLELGDDGTVTSGTGSDQILLDGENDAADATGVTVNLGADISDTLDGADNTVNLGEDDSLAAFGGGNSIQLASGDTLVAGATDLTFDTVAASSDTITLDDDVQVNLSGSDDSISLGTGDSLGAYGGGNTIDAGAGDLVVVGSTGTNLDTVNAAGDISGSATANGQATGIYVDDGAQANVAGGDDTVNLGTSSYLGLLGGFSYSVNASGDTIATWADTNFNLGGDSNTVELGTGDSLGAYGGGNTIDAGGGDLVYIGDTNGVFDSVNADGDAQGGTSADGQPTGIDLTDDVQVNLFGSDNGVVLGTGDSLGAYGGGNTIDSGADDLVYIGETNGAFDVVDANGDALGSTTANGQPTEIGLASNAQANVYGSDNGIAIGTGDSLGAYGGGNTIDSGAEDIVVIGDTNGDIDSVNATGDVAGGTTANGQPTGISVDADAQANVAGGNDTVNVGAGAYLGLLGGSGYLVNASSATIETTGGTSFNLAGGDDSVGLGGTGDYLGLLGGGGYTVTAISDTIETLANTSFNLAGGDDTVDLGGGSYVALIGGSGYVVNASSSTVLTTAGANFDLGGFSDTVELGGGSHLDLVGGTGNVINATDGSVSLGPGTGATINGSGNAVGLDGNGISVSAPNDTVDVFYGESGETIYASNTTIVLADYDQVNIVGSNDRIDGSLHDAISVNGESDPVSASDSVIAFSGPNAGDIVSGAGDTGADWGGYGGQYGGNSGLGTGLYFSTSGAAAGILRTMNTVAQYDLSQGDTNGALASDAAWSRSEQAVAAAANPAVSPPPPFNGIHWKGPVVTWSFAVGSGTGDAPFSGSIQPQYQAAIEQAIETWAAATGLTFEEVPDSAASDIRIGWGTFDTSVSGTVGNTSADGYGSGEEPSSLIVRLEDPSQDKLVAGPDGALT